MTKPKCYVESAKVTSTSTQTGIVKIDFMASDNGSDEEVVQIIVSAANLQGIMQSIGEKMQKTFGGRGPGGPGGPGGGRKGGPGGGKDSPFGDLKDLTKD